MIHMKFDGDLGFHFYNMSTFDLYSPYIPFFLNFSFVDSRDVSLDYDYEYRVYWIMTFLFYPVTIELFYIYMHSALFVLKCFSTF